MFAKHLPACVVCTARRMEMAARGRTDKLTYNTSFGCACHMPCQRGWPQCPPMHMPRSVPTAGAHARWHGPVKPAVTRPAVGQQLACRRPSSVPWAALTGSQPLWAPGVALLPLI